MAVEKDQYAIDTYDYNHNKKKKRRTIILQQDIETIGRDILLNAVYKARKVDFSDVDLVAGGPPCQGFSVIGPRSLTDPRNRLFFHFVRVISIVRPKVFLAENVKGILSFAGGKMPALLEKVFDELGYILSYGLVNSKHFGVPQDRTRVIFFGIRNDIARYHDKTSIRLPQPSMPPILKGKYPNGYQITVGEALSDLPSGRDVAAEDRIWVNNEGTPHVGSREDLVFEYYSDPQNAFQSAMRKDSKALYDNHTKGISMTRLEKIREIPEGEDAASPSRKNAWRRLSRRKLSHTLQAHMGKDMKEFIHPEVNRWITVREAARLQTFDDSYRFLGSQSAQLKQIGNAVPPYLGWAIGRTIGEELGLFKSNIIKTQEGKNHPDNLFQEDFGLRNVINNFEKNDDIDIAIAQILNKIFDELINQ